MKDLENKTLIQKIIEYNVTNGLGYSHKKNGEPFHYQNDLDLQHILGSNEALVSGNLENPELSNGLMYVCIIKDWVDRSDPAKILRIKYPSQIENIGKDIFSKCLTGKRCFDDVLNDYCSDQFDSSYNVN